MQRPEGLARQANETPPTRAMNLESRCDDSVYAIADGEKIDVASDSKYPPHTTTKTKLKGAVKRQ